MAGKSQQVRRPLISSGSASSAASNIYAGRQIINESSLHKTGIRGRKLIILLVIITVLWFIALSTLLCNILLLTRLRMGAHGMDWLQLINHQNRYIVQFLSSDAHLSTVSPLASIHGYPDQAMVIEGREVNMNVQDVSDKQKISSVKLKNDSIRMDGVDHFAVVNQHGEIVFDTFYPQFKLPEDGVHRLRSNRIFTNRVTSPVDETLRIYAGNLTFRGNEGNSFTGKSVNLRAATDIVLESQQNGRIRLAGADGIVIEDIFQLPISESPSLSADILAQRICVCASNGRIFSVPGNKPCALPNSWCF